MMAAMRYPFPRNLRLPVYRIEAGGRYVQADPLVAKAVVLDKDDVRIWHLGPDNIRRLATGLLEVAIPDTVPLDEAAMYQLVIEAQMTPGNWQPFGCTFVTPADITTVPGACLLHGRAGLGSSITLEAHTDAIGCGVRTGTLSVEPDAFGNWYARLPYGTIVRVVDGSRVRTVKIPECPFAEAVALPHITLSTPRTDAHAYPAP
jgi:hypothetical protein